MELELERGVQRVRHCVYATMAGYMWHVQRLVHELRKKAITTERMSNWINFDEEDMCSGPIE